LLKKHHMIFERSLIINLNAILQFHLLNTNLKHLYHTQNYYSATVFSTKL